MVSEIETWYFHVYSFLSLFLIMKEMNKPTVLYGRKISSCELAHKTVFRIHPVSFPRQSASPCKYIFFRPGWANFARAESEPSTMQFISRELRPFWKAAWCAVSLWCNKNFKRGILHTRLNQFFSQTWDALFLFQTFLRLPRPRLYSHNMLISQGDADIIELGRARIHRTWKHGAYHRSQKLPDRSELALWMSFGVEWWLRPKDHFAAVERQLGKCERISSRSSLLGTYRNIDLHNYVTTAGEISYQRFHIVYLTVI